MLIGYGAPLLITLLTGIVQASAPWCSPINPRFGEESCFFAGNIELYLKTLLSLLQWNLFIFLETTSKFVFFYLPIMILLIFNSIMFSLTVRIVYMMDKQKRNLGMVSGQRSNEMER